MAFRQIMTESVTSPPFLESQLVTHVQLHFWVYCNGSYHALLCIRVCIVMHGRLHYNIPKVQLSLSHLLTNNGVCVEQYCDLGIKRGIK